MAVIRISFVLRDLVSREKFNVYLIGVIHILLVCYGIYALIEEELKYQEPFLTCEGFIIAAYYTIHCVLIYSLFTSIYKDSAVLMIPWILSALISFIIVTAQILFAIKDIRINAFMYLMNFVYVGLYWYAFYIVYEHFVKLRRNMSIIDVLSRI